MTSRLRPVLVGGLFTYSGLILLLTLGAIPQRLPGSQGNWGVLSIATWLDSATWSTGWSGEFYANIALFVPWALLAVLAIGSRRWWWILAAGAAFSMTIEIIQIFSARISDPRDFVANTLGVVIGVAIGLLIRARSAATDPPERARPRVAVDA